MMTNGKEIIAQYYEKEISKSYYLGCSSGTRTPTFHVIPPLTPSIVIRGSRGVRHRGFRGDGFVLISTVRLKEVQDFPEDFDGVVCGATSQFRTCFI